MHYIGMAALRGPVEISWDAGYVLASLNVGTTMSALALRLAMRRQSQRGNALAALLLTLGICALHFTGMTAVTLTPVVGAAADGTAFAPASLAVAVAAIALLIIALGLAGTLVDQHLAERAESEAARLRAYAAQLEATTASLEETSRNLTTALTAAAQSNQAKSQFLAAMSHELRTPLNAIIGYSELMKLELYGPLGDHRYGEYLGDIHASGSHLLSLVNEVLDLARLDANRIELDDDIVELRELIDDALRCVAVQAREANITVERDAASELPRVRIDRRRVKQIMLNLLSNAMKFTPSGGHVSVAATRVHDGITIAVADTGIGMQPEDIPTALSRFGQIDSTLARKYQGTGLGLPIAQQLIELHGGTLMIESKVDMGTTVTLRLPYERVLDMASPAAAA